MEVKPEKWFLKGNQAGKYDYSYSTAEIRHDNLVTNLDDDSFVIECMNCIKVDDDDWPVSENCNACIFSKTYIGISDKLYQYNYGLGITGENQEFYKTFEVYCSQSLVIENCRNFISKIGMCEEYCEIQEGIRKNLINTCIKFLVKNKVKIAEVNTAYIENILKKYWGIEEMAYICLELVKQCQGHEETIKKKGWLFPYRKIRKDSHIVLYGAGDVGQDFYKQLKDTGYCDIILWVDKAYEKYREYGLNVESPYKIQLCDFDYILIAMSNTAVKNQIKNELLNIGINNDKIV